MCSSFKDNPNLSKKIDLRTVRTQLLYRTEAPAFWCTLTKNRTRVFAEEPKARRTIRESPCCFSNSLARAELPGHSTLPCPPRSRHAIAEGRAPATEACDSSKKIKCDYSRLRGAKIGSHNPPTFLGDCACPECFPRISFERGSPAA